MKHNFFSKKRHSYILYIYIYIYILFPGDYDELMASHAAVGDNPDNEDESQDGDVSSYR